MKNEIQNKDIIYLTISDTLKKYEFERIRFRLLSNYLGYISTPTILNYLLENELISTPKKLIELYEDITQDYEEPHYEDIIVALLISILGSIIGYLSIKLFERHDRFNKDKLTEFILVYNEEQHNIIINIKKDFARPITYLFRAYNLRKCLDKNYISREEHDKILSNLSPFRHGGTEKFS